MTKLPQTQQKIAIGLTGCASLFFLVRLVQIITPDENPGRPGLTAGIASGVYFPRHRKAYGLPAAWSSCSSW
ncbi:MAG: hypothetical protein KJ947_22305 [Alphaproteobacteria bacterium]|jgi:hypothetical protein|nr:hypothetical protein [Alphaproteobacteria bacterium]MBU1552281.1 hypothetical protein [Alphaproteobacteria bacterium]MBU2336811.1 hypothetical protein [Alphaproteobacteria bacterium]MBU2389567.1 hypothetical protein [Alphaproteobacteria bacterium]